MDNIFLGGWHLVSSTFKSSDGQIHFPLGQRVVGILHYDPKGYMAAQLYNAERQTFEQSDHAKGSDQEIRQAFTTSLCYFGRYEIDEEQNQIIHHVEGCTFPNWIGQAQRRFYHLAGNTLTLSTPPIELGGVLQTGELVWRRA